MTPDETGEMGVDEKLEAAGVGSVDEAIELAQKHKSREGYDGRKDAEIRKLNLRLETLEGKKEEERLGIGEDASDNEKAVAREILSLRKQVRVLTLRAVASPDDEALEPFMQEARNLFPGVEESITDPIQRVDAFRRIARDLKAEAEGTPDKDRRVTNPSRAALSGGGSPVSKRESMTDDQLTERFQRDLRSAQTKADKTKVKEAYKVRYPRLFPD